MTITSIAQFVAKSLIMNSITNANTDNKGKLFVTVFAFAPAPKTTL